MIPVDVDMFVKANTTVSKTGRRKKIEAAIIAGERNPMPSIRDVIGDMSLVRGSEARISTPR
jgi:hypothetical protein|tara:strand:- start:1500 stop:1685 length:186 start_codon:yes stop_codon:yes gene_type:complete